MDEDRALHQDIRPLRVAILNLMPTKIATETQLLRLLSATRRCRWRSPCCTPHRTNPRTPPPSICSTTTAPSRTSAGSEIRRSDHHRRAGGAAAVRRSGLLERTAARSWIGRRRTCTPPSTSAGARRPGCITATASPSIPCPSKMFGVFEHRVMRPNREAAARLRRHLLRPALAPHRDPPRGYRKGSRSEASWPNPTRRGLHRRPPRDGRHLFVTGHSEYDPLTLKGEYDRDVNKGLPINVPANYYVQDDPKTEPCVRWRGHANLLYSNWLNYYVYQSTPFHLHEIPGTPTVEP